ncbi:hypothetical protein ACFVV3_36630, partial [Streptomyces sp. NPDC058142]
PHNYAGFRRHLTLTAAHARSTAFSFDTGGHETWAPASVAGVMVGVAVLNFMASTWGQTLTWVFSSPVLALNTLMPQRAAAPPAAVGPASRPGDTHYPVTGALTRLNKRLTHTSPLTSRSR